MEIELSLDFVRVVEEAAIEAARTMGRGGSPPEPPRGEEQKQKLELSLGLAQKTEAGQ